MCGSRKNGSDSSAEISFSDIDIAKARLIRDLQEYLGVNDEGVSVGLNLVDQLYGMRRALAELTPLGNKRRVLRIRDSPLSNIVA
jgi:hypothetical protein